MVYIRCLFWKLPTFIGTMANLNTNKAQLIAEIYEVVLRPERYDKFMELWEGHISQVFDQPEQLLNDSFSIAKHINDPELVSHFQRAYEILEKIGREGKRVDGAEQYSAQKKEPAFFIDANNAVVHKNQSAQKLLGEITSIEEFAPFIDKNDYRKLRAMLLGLNHPDIAEQAHVFHFDIDSSKSGAKNKPVLFFAKAMRFSRNQPAILCIYVMGIDWDEGLELLLSDAFSLTPSELQVVRGLCEGRTQEEIAKQRNRSLFTIRTQVKKLMHKTSTSSQVDLVRLVITMASFGRSPSLKLANISKHLEMGTQVIVPLGNKREIPVHQIGDPKGYPVLFIHGMLDGIAVCKSITKLLKKNKIRLIAPVRPNFADSRAAYNIKTAPEEFVIDLCQIMDHLEIEVAPIIGHMAGSIYAFAAASILPDRISAILNISGGIPIKSLRQLSSMASRQRVVAWTARFAPNLLPAIIRAGISKIDRGDESEFMNALHAKGSKDRDVVANMNIRTIIHAGYQFAIAQGHRAFEVDSHHVTRDWSSYVENIQQRVILVHGVFDPTVRIESVRKFAELYNNIELIEHDDAGQLLFFQKPKAIISSLNSLLN